MNKEKYNQIIDEAYENYLNNFIPPTCPSNLDVQPDYYKPMTKEWFIKSIKERGLRGDEFSEKWGLKIEERELSLEERYDLIEKDKHTQFVKWQSLGTDRIREVLDDNNIPTKLITIKYKNETIESYV